MTDDDLKKQLTNYADAITGFSFVQAIALIYAFAQGEGFAQHVFDKHGPTATTICIVAATFDYCLVIRQCMTLSSELPPPTDTAVKVMQSVQSGRFAITICGGTLSIIALWLINFHRLPPLTCHV